jgi:hypothetical protein
MTDHFTSLAPSLIANGYLVVPIRKGEKRPAISGWQNARLSAADARSYPDHGVGVLCGQGANPIVGVDIDISHPVIGPALIAWCQENLGYGGERVGAAPRILLAYRAEQAGWTKGLSVAFYDPTDPVKANGKRNEQRVELLGDGQQFVAYHRHPDTGTDYEWVDLMGGLAYMPADSLPAVSRAQVVALLAETARLVALAPGLEVDTKSATSPRGINVACYPCDSTEVAIWDDDLMGLSPTLDWSLEHAREVMLDLNADCDRATWVNDLAALHHEMGGSDEALELAVEWSQSAGNFDSRKDVEDRWASFGKYRGGTPMTGRWLLKRRQECKAHLKYDARADWLKQIAASTEEFHVREKLCPQIARDDRLDDLGKEALAQALLDCFKRLGTKYPIAECRKLLVEKRQQKDRDADMPPWAEPWVYVTDDDKFFRPDSEEWLTTQGFNAKFSRELPTDENGNLTTTAAFVALNVHGIKTVTRALYLPWSTTATFLHSGVECVNTYRPSSPPTPVAHLSAADHEAIRVVTRHIELLAGGRREIVTTMLNWLAHNVQNPGIKIRWAPLWKGIEGDGKTVIGSLVSAVMGRPNVKNVTPKVLGTDFTGWAQGSAVVVLEEIRLTGHSRHDILNALKPFITNDSIEVHPKGKDTIEVVNTTNYLSFTNFNDALPLTDTDRRWWIVFTPFANSDEMEAAVLRWAPDLGTYFTTLHDAIQKHPAALRKWLLDYQISADFKPNGRAPMTDEKAVMIDLGVSDEELAVREILDNSEASDTPGEVRAATRGVTPTLFSSRCLGDALMLADNDVTINGMARHRLFSKMGFTRLSKKVKWDGDAHVIWAKGVIKLEPDYVRQVLGKTVSKNWGEGESDSQTAQIEQKGSVYDDLF